MYIIDDPVKKREKNVRQFADPLYKKANSSVNAQNNPNTATKVVSKNIQKYKDNVGAENLRNQYVALDDENVYNEKMNSVKSKDILNNTKGSGDTIPWQYDNEGQVDYQGTINKMANEGTLTMSTWSMLQNERNKKIASNPEKYSGYIGPSTPESTTKYDEKGNIDYAGTILAEYEAGTLTPEKYANYMQQRGQKMADNLELYGNMDVGVLSPSAILELHKRTQPREAISKDIETRYNPLFDNAKKIGRAAEEYAITNRDNTVDAAKRRAEALKRQVEQEWWSQSVPEVKERIANMGVSANGGFSRQENLMMQANLMNELNDIELEKEQMISDAEIEFAKLMMQGKTDEANALMDAVKTKNKAYENRISELDNEAIALAGYDVEAAENAANRLADWNKLLKTQNFNRENMFIADQIEDDNVKVKFDNDVKLIDIEFENLLKQMGIKHAYDKVMAEIEKNNAIEINNNKPVLTGKHTEESLEEQVNDALIMIGRLGDDFDKKTIHKLPFSAEVKKTLKYIYGESDYNGESDYKKSDLKR